MRTKAEAAHGSREARAELPGFFLAGFLAAVPALAFGQASNQITQIEPDSAPQGTTGLLVTFTLDTDSPPAPPAGAPPSSVTIGTLGGAAITHATQYVVTAVFDIPAGEPEGPKDAAIAFLLPGGGTLVFSRSAGFTVTSGGNLPPAITRHPRSQTVPLGGCATFSVTASGTAPLRYQWQKDGSAIAGATEASYAIGPVAESDAGDYRCVVTNDLGSATSDEARLTVAEPAADGYPVVDTGQVKCYDDRIEITCPAPGQPFYGQDSQVEGRQPSFSVRCDGLTVLDAVTGLTWQRSPDTDADGSITSDDKLTWAEAQGRPAVLNAAHHGGYNDWRLPTIKELYSLIDFRGTDPPPQGGGTAGLTPFIDTDFFGFAYGDPGAGERIIDSQYASSTLYVGSPSPGEWGKLFGVNFADGRIKGYGLRYSVEFRFFVQCVRGNMDYGLNDYTDNGDGTITDDATGLMWSKQDGGSALTWEEALAWVQTSNAANQLGHADWRLPNAKELQSIVDYTRAPDAVDPSHRGPAIDPVFSCTQITGEACAVDYPWYWAGTTHGNPTGSGAAGVYVCVGRSTGFMNNEWLDIHGAGSQRSDPKSGSLSGYAHNACGYYNSQAPQGDAVRIHNYVRLVRDATTSSDIGPGDTRHGSAVRLAMQAGANPFSGVTSLVFTLPAPGWARLDVCDVAGRRLITLLDERLAAGVGRVAWDGTDGAGRPVRSGVYFATLVTPSGTRSVKLTLVRR